ncbi:SGNH hydrolase-type esterase domain-containing protein [Aspergillus heterothallicus]
MYADTGPQRVGLCLWILGLHAPGPKKKIKRLCPGPDITKEGKCKPELAARNADSFAMIASDLYFSLEHHVHLGDSYAAGLGTGKTSGDCSNHACSGDTTVELHGQIDDWLLKDPVATTLVTLSIGGNDLKFSQLVWNYVLVGWPFISKEKYLEQCEKFEREARAHLADPSENGLGHKLTTVYRRILYTYPDVHLYVPGYAGFFNHDTTDCDLTTFYYPNPRHDSSPSNTAVYLTLDLRRELNDLVQLLNNRIIESIREANANTWPDRAFYDADFYEPDPNGKSWFFLSGWPDAYRDGPATAESEAIEDEEIRALIEAGRVPIPDACVDQLENAPRPYDQFLCRVAVNVAEDPDGPEAQRLDRANDHIANRNYTSQDIPWYGFTRQIKTFHPWTAGMAQYWDAVIETIRAAG